MTLRVALIDDHLPFRQRLRALLEKAEDVEIVAEAGSGHELLQIAPTTEMDVACMDISMPGMNGIEATRRLLAGKPGVRVIGLSAYADEHYIEAMMNAGAVGYFTKGEVGEELLRALYAATVERPCFGPDIAYPLAANTGSESVQPPVEAAPACLGIKEREVLRLIGAGAASAQIAQSLAIYPGMVDVYRRNIMRKLHLNTEAELAQFASRNAAIGHLPDRG